MPARGQHGRDGKSRKAAELHLDEGVPVVALCERFGVGRTAVWQAVHRLRKERAVQQAGGAP
jgi:DNA-binding GntR family transcriptional regulator